MSTAPTVFIRSKKAFGGPDPVLARYQLELIQNLYNKIGPYEFSKRAFWILRKNPEEGEKDILPSTSDLWNRRLVPFVHNRIQRDLDDKIIVAGSRRNIMLKPRQAGYTTWSIIMRLLMPALIEPGVSSMLISQNAEYAAAHFDILKRAWRYFFVADPYNEAENDWAVGLRRNLLHVAYSNRRELIFDQLDSRVRCASAEVEEVGQGITLNHLVATELSRWEHNPEETMANVKEAIAMEGTLDIECTPNGLGGYFYEEWQRANNVVPGKPREFTPHFHTWWWHDEYSRKPAIDFADLTLEERAVVQMASPATIVDGEQIAWRRQKIESLRHNFAEKYPEDDVSCLHRGAVVLLADGTTRTISKLVKDRYRGKVLSVSDNKIVGRQVTGWYRSNRNGRRLYRMTYRYGKKAHGMDAGVILTEEHKVLSQYGWKRADECNNILVATGTPAPGPRAFQIIIGTILGDAHVSDRRKLELAQTHKSYVSAKARVLKAFGAKTYDSEPYGIGKKGKRTLYTKPFPYFAELREKFYSIRKKRIPWDIVGKINELGLAIWYMDDGWLNLGNGYKSLANTRIKPFAGIHLGVLSKDQGDKLATMLSEKGFTCWCNHICNKKYRIIRFNFEGTRRLSDAIGKYVLPELRYKLLPKAPKFDKSAYSSEEPTVFWDVASVKEVKPEKQKRKYEKSPVYCLDVDDTHNFVTLGGVVHNCFIVGGNAFFEKEIVSRRIKELQNYEPIEKRNKFVVYQRPVKHRRYVIGADPATGLPVTNENPDYSAAVVIDLETGEEMAAYRAHVLPEDFAQDLVELAEEYNDALVCVERLSEGGSVITYMTYQLGYWNLYKHVDWFRKAAPSKDGKTGVKELLGFPTNTRNRPLSLNRARWFLSNCPHLVWDVQYLKECSSFIYNEKGKPEAQKGAHDDTVLARGLAYYCRSRANGELTPESIKREKYGAVPTEFSPPELIN